MDKSNHKQSSKRMLGMKHTNRRVWAERGENRIGPAKHVSHRAGPISIPGRDNPNLQAVVTSPGWPEMSLSARVIAVTLFALARMDAGNSVTISRPELSDLTGITDPNTLAKANRELQAIGLFEIKRGFRTKYAGRPTVYRLTWWSQVFQRWLKAGYAVPDTGTSSTTDTPHHQGTSTSVGFAPPTVPVAAGKGSQPEAHNDLSIIAQEPTGVPAVSQKENQWRSEHPVADTQTLHETSCWSRSRQRNWLSTYAWTAEGL